MTDSKLYYSVAAVGNSAGAIFDDEISKTLEYLRYKGTEIVGENWYSDSVDAAVVDCGGCLVAFGAHNPRWRNSALIYCSTVIG